MAMGTRKLGPALAAGCTSVIKPAAQTPLSMLALGKILQEVGCPDGVVNIITTHSSGAVMEPLIRSGKARKLSFTGSTQVGRRLMEQCAERVMRTSMELGGNAALIVFDDADLDVAVEGALAAKMRNNGQACTAANRIYVQSGIASAFIDAYSTAMAARTMGRGVEPTTLLGPLVDEPSRAKVQQLVDDAVSRGARVVTGGEVPDGAGFFYPATVLADVPADAEIRTEEIFGPVAPIATFETEAEVIAAANDTEYGLIGYVFTNDLNRALRVSEALETGMVGVNAGVISNPAAPFGGMKESGIGREGGDIGIDEFLEVKYINIPLPPA
jgi:succinate-semialdehyde dehydrogenase/glutarate-semialdehyde dehydrogenase